MRVMALMGVHDDTHGRALGLVVRAGSRRGGEREGRSVHDRQASRATRDLRDPARKDRPRGSGALGPGRSWPGVVPDVPMRAG